MFLLKKLVAPLVFPVPIIVLLLVIGVALLWFTRRQKAGKVLVTSGLVILVVLSYNVANPLLRSLEHTYPPPERSVIAQAKWVIVLGGGTSSDPAVPLNARASSTTLARLVEGVKLQRQIPGSRLLLSGAAVFSGGSDAESMAAIATAIGVPREVMVLEDESQDTESQAINARRIIGSERCVLVTSAAHMHRSIALFRKAGLDPIPAPAKYEAQVNPGFDPGDFYPRVTGLNIAQIAEHEYLGIAWAWLRGRI